MKLVKKSSKLNSTGSIALYLVMIVSILLMTTTLFASRQAVSEISQASDVDQSAQAYYAAEAGVEEAISRLDSNTDPGLDIEDIFPEQFSAGLQPGDRAVLIDNSGSDTTTSGLNVVQDDTTSIVGDLAWRQRKVYESDFEPTGELVKDESAQIDVSELRRDCAGGVKAGATGLDCDGSNIFDNLGSVEFCWLNRIGSAAIELSTISWPAGNINNIETRKVLIQPTGTLPSTNYITLFRTFSSSYDGCFRINVDSNRRYIFRMRAVYDVGNPPNPNELEVSYRIQLKDRPGYAPAGGNLYIPDDLVLVDSVGQSGTIRRRIVARVARNGKILGLFDYVLYSGDPVLPLCKAGVQQSDVGYDENCIVTKIDLSKLNLPVWQQRLTS